LFCLFHTSKATIDSINKNRNILINLFKNTISIKNLEINRLINRDFNREYDIDEKDLEKLMRDYIMNKKSPGKELKTIINTSVNYIEREIKRSLGMPLKEGKKSLIGS
jgi:hypothetical protein